MDLRTKIRDVHDFPKPGIIFKDITPLLADTEAWNYCIKQFIKLTHGKRITKIVGIDSRGFIFGAALADRLKIGFVPVRKPGKLPAATHSESYALEYGSDKLEIHQDALHYTDRVLLIDDLLATGGTASAACKLIRRCGADVSMVVFLIELSFLNGRSRLGNYPVHSLIKYDAE
ncbi:MAG: adenine phosphoribosyltransferase [Calditrichaeota bacterium]|nr:adenine phosphoribosyltransferase [Calditrichota bacterium]